MVGWADGLMASIICDAVEQSFETTLKQHAQMECLIWSEQLSHAQPVMQDGLEDYQKHVTKQRREVQAQTNNVLASELSFKERYYISKRRMGNFTKHIAKKVRAELRRLQGIHDQHLKTYDIYCKGARR
ncbi:MAG: DUF6061 family protein [Eubacteriales bacterium]|nr:DUF6061 family protein [Eubacteriales bacterium]